jgi:hypothetical protein
MCLHQQKPNKLINRVVRNFKVLAFSDELILQVLRYYIGKPVMPNGPHIASSSLKHYNRIQN